MGRVQGPASVRPRELQAALDRAVATASSATTTAVSINALRDADRPTVRRKRRRLKVHPRRGTATLFVQKRKHELMHTASRVRKSVIAKVRAWNLWLGQLARATVVAPVRAARRLVPDPFAAQRAHNAAVLRQLKKLEDRLRVLEHSGVVQHSSEARPQPRFPAAPEQQRSPKSSPSAAKGHSGAVSSSPASGELAKYKRMLSFGVPEQAVKNKMVQDGVEPAQLFGGSPQLAGASNRPPAPVARVQISAAALQATRLRSADTVRTPSEAARAAGAQAQGPRAPVTLADLQKIKLRKTPRKPGVAAVSRIDENTPLRGAVPSLGDVLNTRNALKKTTLPRSPGGTPCKRSRVVRTPLGKVHENENLSPSRARSNAEFIELALQKKFRTVHTASPSFASTPDTSRGGWSAMRG